MEGLVNVARKRRGFGRLRQLPSGRWQAAYIGPDTKLHKAPRTYASEHDAEGWLAGERRKIDLGTWGPLSVPMASRYAPTPTSGSSSEHYGHEPAPTTSPCWNGSSCPTSATRKSSR